MTINLGLEKKRRLAADAVLSGKNDEALTLLNELLEENVSDADVLLQRAHVYWLLGDLQKAHKDYKRVLKSDPLNAIAHKKLDALKSLSDSKTGKDRVRGVVIPINSLIEEPGKAKSMRLINIGKHDEIAHLAVGEQLNIKSRKHRIELRDANDTFVGNLPDDISKRLIEMIGMGALYEAFVLSVDKTEAKVLVREKKKPSRLANTPSFLIDDPTKDDSPQDEGDEATNEQSGDDEEGDLDLEDESLVVHGNADPVEEDDEKDQDDDTYREYEE